VKLPDPDEVMVSQPGVKEPSPFTIDPSGRMTGMAYVVEGANPLPLRMTISSGA
jgi:hypothetical protein